jgi:type II protein arginine methyltransferase
VKRVYYSLQTTAYHEAIRKAVRNTTHVLDIGTGTGLLSMMAAKAGAASVTACELHTLMFTVAQQVVALNKLSDKIKIINKHSHDLLIGEDMPHKVLLSKDTCPLTAKGRSAGL